MYIYERMTTEPTTVAFNAKISDALDLMQRNNHKRLPVVDEKGRVAGLISAEMIKDGHFSKNTKILDVMQQGILRINMNKLIEDAALFMKENRIDFLPVIDDLEMLVGVITLADILSAFVTISGVKEDGIRIVLKGENCLERVSEAVSCVSLCGENLSFVSAHKAKKGEDAIVLKIEGKNTENVIFKLEAKGFKVEQAKKEHS